MKELNKDELNRVAYNCKKATLLIEKKQSGVLSLREKLELKIHLAGCSVCRLFEQQSIEINRIYKLYFTESSRHKKLDDQFKDRLAAEIKERINKSL